MTPLELARNYALYTHRNIFLTGKAGTGKTTFLRNLQNECRKRMIVVAPTGVAAINCGGVTIHSFFQLSPGIFLPDGKMVAGRDKNSRYTYNKHKINILRSLDLLVIDEISMVRCDLLDAIDDILRRYQRHDQPFGGVQLLVIGDLQQLAPVATETEWDILRQFYDTPYFFSSQAFLQSAFVTIELTQVFRQQDQDFVRVLGQVRTNSLDAHALALLNSRYDPHFQPPQHEEWITLVTHNAQAAAINNNRLGQLTTPSHTFHATVTGDFPELSYPTERDLVLRVGAQVMFCKNDPSPDKAFYNGRIGQVTDITDDHVCVHLTDTDTDLEVSPLTWDNLHYVTDKTTGQIREESVGQFRQIPLRLAWAITIHKSQGLSFDRAIIDAGRSFSHGQVYVALSRCRTLQGMVLTTPISGHLLLADDRVTTFTDESQQHQPTPGTLALDRNTYIQDILLDIFDFRSISMRLRYLLRLCQEHLERLYPTFTALVAEACTDTDAHLAAVGLKFQPVLRQMMSTQPDYDANQALQERVQRAMEYFLRHTTDILGPLMHHDLPVIDNARIREQVEREFQLLQQDYALKASIFTGCLNHFDLASYWDAKARASMTEETTKSRGTTKKTKTKTATTRPAKTNVAPTRTPAAGTSSISGSVYRRLLDWRKGVAHERKLPEGYILPMKTLITLSGLCPRNLDELAAVPGIGPTILAKYGSELLTLMNNRD